MLGAGVVAVVVASAVLLVSTRRAPVAFDDAGASLRPATGAGPLLDDPSFEVLIPGASSRGPAPTTALAPAVAATPASATSDAGPAPSLDGPVAVVPVAVVPVEAPETSTSAAASSGSGAVAVPSGASRTVQGQAGSSVALPTPGGSSSTAAAVTPATSPITSGGPGGIVTDTTLMTYRVCDAGTASVRFLGSRVEFVGAAPATGWSVERLDDQDGSAVDLRFRSGTQGCMFHAAYVDGRPSVQAKAVTLPGPTTVVTTVSPTTTRPPVTTPPTTPPTTPVPPTTPPVTTVAATTAPPTTAGSTVPQEPTTSAGPTTVDVRIPPSAAVVAEASERVKVKANQSA